MSAILMNSQNSKISDLHIPSLNFTDKMDIRRSDKRVELSDLSIYYTWKNIKKLYRATSLKYQKKHRVNNLMDLILRQIFRTI